MLFDQVKGVKADPIFGLNEAFLADPRPFKVNLSVGIYKDQNLQPFLMPSVKAAKQEILDLSADYLPIDGLPDFLDQLGCLIFSQKKWNQEKRRIYAAQALGGTGALRLAGEFLASEVSRNVLISNPTWPNHRGIFEAAGCVVDMYPYFDETSQKFNCSALCAYLKSLPKKSVIVLHAACHNPTGSDPSLSEWQAISHLMRELELIPCFDFAYQGFGDGIELDAAAVRLFLEEGHEMLVAYSCSKNFSLYCQRVGALFIISSNEESKRKIGSQIKRKIRTLYSNPPAHGVKVVEHILKHPVIRKTWEAELGEMKHRISDARKKLVEKLLAMGSEKKFHSLTLHKGMFSFLPLSKMEVEVLCQKYAIYMTDNGRVSLAGLSSQNIDYVVDCIRAVDAC